MSEAWEPPALPLGKPYPPTPVSYLDWNDLSDNFAGKADGERWAAMKEEVSCTILEIRRGVGGDFRSRLRARF